MCIFFFFQAEDGIRDHCVTGVQTCALPIWRRGSARRTAGPSGWATATPTASAARTFRGRANSGSKRSEERRVGKECRSRWSPERYKKKKPKTRKTHTE